jgi:hypothetical protein
MNSQSMLKKIREAFGDPIGSYAGDAPAGVRDNDATCNECGMMTVSDEDCGCGGNICDSCGMPADKCTCQDAEVCPVCGKMSTSITDPSSCECSKPSLFEVETCECGGMLEKDGTCECGSTHLEEGRKKKRKGPSKSTAKKILRGTKTFAQKMKKVSGWADDPAAGAAWMMHKATGKWPSQK